MPIPKKRMPEGFILQQVGAPSNFHNEVTSYLNAEVPVWIGRRRQSWPSRSPDLTSLDFSVWSFVNRKRILKEMISAIEKNETAQESIDLPKVIAELYKVWKFDATAKTIRNCFKWGGFSNQTDGSDSDDEDAILADLKENGKQ
ncbi:hypothetical protein AVEN_85033-1 [Araneus ventricosus]|uniref:DDE-1 domain-containing protein n=1 Tax=Araneus ventricosus TaxID=182803 RepID=A0A4Y2SA25_ARAVE|nr:hypothetical protein AVEN_85033-1 [Araneus ventricosus]